MWKKVGRILPWAAVLLIYRKPFAKAPLLGMRMREVGFRVDEDVASLQKSFFKRIPQKPTDNRLLP